MADGRALLIVRSNVVPAREAEYNQWYNEVHLRDMLAVPGVLSARRYVSLLDDEPKYAAVYELEGEDVLQTERYLTIPHGRRDGGLPSKWGDDLSGYTRQSYRLLFERQG
jgi:hypothetical protein